MSARRERREGGEIADLFNEIYDEDGDFSLAIKALRRCEVSDRFDVVFDGGHALHDRKGSESNRVTQHFQLA